MAESEFTDTARAALLWVLWHHQGGSSPTGQAIRFALGMGQFDRLAPDQVAQAKAWAPGIPGLAHTDPAGGKAFHITKEPGPAGTSRCRVGPPLNAVYGDEGEARYMIDSYKAVMKTLADRQKRRVMTDGVEVPRG